jgi:hypothetical protein
MSQSPSSPEVVSASELPKAQAGHDRGNERSGVQKQSQGQPPEVGGRAGPEPTRFGDWEKNGRCIDF